MFQWLKEVFQVRRKVKACELRRAGEYTPQSLVRAAQRARYPREKMQEPKRQTAYCYTDGPMYYLGQQIVKAMQDAGYPAKILYCYRSPEHQARLYAKGRTVAGKIVTKAKPWQSAHNYMEAVDIIHPSKAWDVTEDYWEALASCVRIVAHKYDVSLEHGHYWRFRDSAHIELTDWRKQRDRLTERHYREFAEWQADQREQVRHGLPMLADYVRRPPDPAELWQRFYEVLPDVVKDQYRQGTAPKGMGAVHPDLQKWLQGRRK